ncbi:MAG: site-2 protease family protein, partial [Thermoguttaceae bacterium]|nr:site-2 protease family protein [Thermoguttaceae bacterium]
MDLSMTALLGITGEATLWTNVISVAWRVLLVLLGVNMLVIVHEFGHFIVARMCGVRCDKFYIWFDAYGFKLFSFKWGDTEYGLGWVPLGGYVKMLGQEDNPSHIQEEIEKAKLEKKEEGEESQGALEEQSRVQTTSDKDYIKKLEEQLYAPDSYLAKNVFQRMAIISAGVIMNII